MGRKKKYRRRKNDAIKRDIGELSDQEFEALDIVPYEIGAEPLELLEYEITDEPMEDKKYKRLPPQVKDRVNTLYADIAKKPKKMLPEIKAFIKKYPDIPMFYNYLSVAYSHLGQIQKRDQAIKECCERFPKYLFGRLNYAQICLERGEIEKVLKIFDHKLDLKLLYPQRTKFHITEYVSFTAIVGEYYARTGKRDLAQSYYNTLKRIEPFHPATRRLRRVLYPSLMTRSFRWLRKKLSGEKVAQAKGDTNRITGESGNMLQTTDKKLKKLIEELYTIDFFIEDDTMREILSYKDRAIPYLTAILDHCIEHYERYAIASRDTNFLAYHALLLLAELEADDAFLTVLRFHLQGGEFLDFWLWDIWTFHHPSAVARLAKEHIDEFMAILEDPRQDELMRRMISAACGRMTIAYPEKRTQILEHFGTILHQDHDSSFLSSVIIDLLDCYGKELEADIHAAYDHGKIDEKYLPREEIEFMPKDLQKPPWDLFAIYNEFRQSHRHSSPHSLD